jgi:hypothetical protein
LEIAKWKSRDCSTGMANTADFNADSFAGNGLEKFRSLHPDSLPIIPEDVRWGAPVVAGKLICKCAAQFLLWKDCINFHLSPSIGRQRYNTL